MNVFQKIGMTASSAALLLTAAAPVYATIPEAVQEAKEARKEYRDARKDLREEMREKSGSRPGLLKDFLKLGRAAIGSGEVTAINGATLTVEKDGKSYTVLTDDKTQFRRRFWGKGGLTEILVGHTVNVIGLWTDEAHTTIQARLVRDLSIQRRFGVFFGVVQSLTANGWVMTTVNDKRENQMVEIDSETKLVNRREQTILQADIAVGHRVRVKGLWDRVSNIVSDVAHVKDFSLPAQGPTATVTATVTVTSTPTVTPTPTETPTPTPTP